MSRIVWDPIGERRYETGVDRGVVYPHVAGAYPEGEAWNGLISVTKSPSGAEATPLWANNHKYANLISAEELGFSIEAYMYPDSFAQCNGELELKGSDGKAIAGVYVGQQKRVPFGFTYRTMIGSDTDPKKGYKISLIYGAYAGPSEDADTTINDSPEAKTMSWECTTTPVDVTGFEPTAIIEIDSTKVSATGLAALEAVLYGSESEEARLPLPDEVVTLVGTAG